MSEENTRIIHCAPEDHEWHELTDRYKSDGGFGLGFMTSLNPPQIDVMCSKCGDKAIARQPDGALVRDLPPLRDGFEVRVTTPTSESKEQ
jgi:hypothetical protein